MSRQNCHSGPSCCSPSLLGGIAASDFAALDRLAVKFICLDGNFAAPLREMGRVIGERIAREQNEKSICLDAALSALISACGLDGMIESRFLHRNAEGARLQISGCAAVLGYQVPAVERTVCNFNVGVFEGYLRGVTGEEALSVEEIACLGMGHACCEFAIHRQQALGEREGESHGCR
jgi:predicted hydrocarbon binding protein